MAESAFQAPKGTRDFYPEDAARRRFITEAWRSASVRHGFEEVDGPIFEHLDLYTVKSGEGIVSELFSFTRAGGEKDYALRPEFTPTLARLFAARAGSLPKPTRWFMAGPFFRAEKPQRGRLREFLQWNADILGDASPAADAEIIATCVSLLASLGLTSRDVRVKVNHRAALGAWLSSRGLAAERQPELFKLLDARGKMPPQEFASRIGAFGFSAEQAEVFLRGIVRITVPAGVDPRTHEVDPLRPPAVDPSVRDVLDLTYFSDAVMPLARELVAAGIIDWVDFDLSIVRGLAYYTGMVFEVHEAAGAERAIAGGGRYDNLVELFGGPSTPAVGFGMGDVVLGLVLEDRGLMPKAGDLFRRIGAAPDVFVIPGPNPAADALVKPVVARLRAAGLHARHTSKTTRNIGKLLKEAVDQSARFALILESDSTAAVKDLTSGAQSPVVPLADAIARLTGRE
ncbi:MAG: histidine--tRNA ligase [Phycisphaerales bacterium]|nr:histidine--tRNA ligase [Planctomycetota bacterium]